MKRLIPLALAASANALFAADGIWIKSDTGTTPQTAADYATAANWSGGYVPGAGDTAYFTNAYTTTRYVKLPSTLSLTTVYSSLGGSSSQHTRFLGDSLTLEGANKKGGTLYFKGADGLVQIVYADVYAPYGFSMTHAALAGDIDAPSSATVTFSAGNIGFYADQYANSSARVRYPWGQRRIGQVMTGSPTLVLTGPQSSSVALNGTYAVTEGSPYLTFVSGTGGNSLVVGSEVSGEGIPDGAFIRRIFSNSIIEISAEATADVAASALRFEPLVPEVHLETEKLYLSGSPSIYFDSLGSETDLRLEAWALEQGSKQTFKLARNNTQRVPGTFVTHTTKNFRPAISVGETRFEFAEAAAGEMAGFPNARSFAVYSGATSRLTVTNGISAVVPVLTNIVGTVVKAGAGTLTAPLASSGNTGTLRIEAGSFVVSAAQAGRNIAKLELGEGAFLQIPSGVTLSVGTLTAASDARLEGPGTLEVLDETPDLSNLILHGGVQIKVAGAKGTPILENPTGDVVGEPAIWLKADDASSLTLDGANVLRWNDCRGEGYLFATNIVEKPTLESGSAGNYVKFAHLSLKAHYLVNEQVLVWSEVVSDIRAIFAVIDPSDGGGYLLGRSSRIPDSCSSYCGGGGFFYRQNNAWWKPIWSADYQPAGSQIYIDGERVASNAAFREPSAQLVEIHLPAGSGFKADALGSGYSDGGTEDAANGNLRAHEYIVYTNELSATERQKVAQYLMQKWLKRSAPITAQKETVAVTPPNSYESVGGVEVAADETITLESLGGGEFVKSGAGSLYLDGVSGGDLRVSGGEAVIRSFGLTAETLPNHDTCYLHLDATVDSSMVKNVLNGTNFVTRWNDVRGTTGYYYVTKPGTDSGAPTTDGWLHENVANNKPMVDLGPAVYASGAWAKPSPFHALSIRTPTGTWIPGTQYNGANGPAIKSIFIAYDSSGGGNALLAARGSGWTGAIGLATRTGSSSAANPERMFAYSNSTGFGATGEMSSLYQAAQNITSGSGFLLRQNGETFDPWHTAFSGGQDVFVLSTEKWPRKTGGFAIEGYDNYVGGLMYGEILLYTNFVGQAETKQIEAYLLKKWKGIDTPGYTTSALDKLTVDDGATVRVTGGAPLTVTTLNARGGSIVGAVKLAANAVIEVPVLDDGTLGTVALGSNVDLASGVTVRLVGNVNAARSGTYSVVTSDAIATTEAARWSFTQPTAAKRKFAFAVTDGALRITVTKNGLVFVIQ